MANSGSVEDPSSVRPAAAGDTSRMWAEFSGPLRAFVARRVPPGIEPDDVVQEVFVRVMRHVHSSERDRAAGWPAGHLLYRLSTARIFRPSASDVNGF